MKLHLFGTRIISQEKGFAPVRAEVVIASYDTRDVPSGWVPERAGDERIRSLNGEQQIDFEDRSIQDCFNNIAQTGPVPLLTVAGITYEDVSVVVARWNDP